MGIIKKNKVYLTGSLIAFLYFFMAHASKMEGVEEWIYLILSSMVVGMFSWFYLAAKVFLAIVGT